MYSRYAKSLLLSVQIVLTNLGDINRNDSVLSKKKRNEKNENEKI